MIVKNCSTCSYYSSYDRTCCRPESKKFMKDVQSTDKCSKYDNEKEND